MPMRLRSISPSSSTTTATDGFQENCAAAGPTFGGSRVSADLRTEAMSAKMPGSENQLSDMSKYHQPMRFANICPASFLWSDSHIGRSVASERKIPRASFSPLRPVQVRRSNSFRNIFPCRRKLPSGGRIAQSSPGARRL